MSSNKTHLPRLYEKLGLNDEITQLLEKISIFDRVIAIKNGQS